MSHLFPQVCPNIVTTGSALSSTTTGALIPFSTANGWITFIIQASAYSTGTFTATLYGCDTLTSGALTTSHKIADVYSLAPTDIDVHVVTLTMSDGLLPYMRLDMVKTGGTSVTLSSCTAIYQLWC